MQELVLELCHVDVRGAFALAALALEAEVEGFVESAACEGVGGQSAGDGGAKEVGAAPGGVLFVAGCHEGGTHGAVGLATGAHAVAHIECAFEAVLVGEVKPSGEGEGLVAGAVAQIVGQGRGVDDLAGIQDAVGVEGLLDLPESVVDFGAEHLLRPDASNDAVAVFAAEGAAEFLDEVGDFGGDGGHGVQSLLSLEADEGADVEAADAGVAVVAGGGAVIANDFVEAADEEAEVLRVDGGVFDEGDGLGVAADAHEQAEAGFANGPDVGLLRRCRR